MYQDAEGTTPVTAVEQPVGKMLDKSGNGYHATQSITASRPTLSARYNLLTKTEYFSDAVWGKYGITISPAIGPTGSLDAYTLTEDTSTGYHRINQSVSTVSSVFNVRIKAAGCDYCAISWRANNDLRYDTVVYNLTTKSRISVQNASGLYISDGITDAGDGWVDIKIYLNSSTQFIIACANQIKNTSFPTYYTGDGVSGITVWHPTVSSCVLPNTYQRVNTATDYDTDERYFKKYLRFDGVDDYLNLPHMGLYGGGSASIVCARDAVSQATDTYIISERSTTDADPKYFPSRQLANAGNMDTYITDDAGAVVLDTVGSPFSGVANAVIRSIVDSGNNLKLFKNGVLAANDNYTRSGTLTLNTTTIGASVSTTTSNYASMKLYGLIVTKSALSDTDRRRCEQFLASRLSTLGVTLS
ncbi:MAG: hypothetical protein EOM41_01130 [Bacilli bacterium]|nr:hypothetical protein [Bacilli bacterium]